MHGLCVVTQGEWTVRGHSHIKGPIHNGDVLVLFRLHPQFNASPSFEGLLLKVTWPTALDTAFYGNSFVRLPISGVFIAKCAKLTRRSSSSTEFRYSVGFFHPLFLELSIKGIQTMEACSRFLMEWLYGRVLNAGNKIRTLPENLV
ncbi:hypothetical protein PAXRUDRAFT_241078 [Paxillus rubicundulus Ve08.2h10]|uniref:Uncharacterized protein n=1 Tax=Paxillus rubicundulus Ve08.2h10 TaxID=930991 RepID=A0A0D0D960_9AGAM|nr:hypothetical protein PAXRUDRAFT_241078 [Paxillus rubicundulus Ve08.2h10]